MAMQSHAETLCMELDNHCQNAKNLIMSALGDGAE